MRSEQTGHHNRLPRAPDPLHALHQREKEHPHIPPIQNRRPRSPMGRPHHALRDRKRRALHADSSRRLPVDAARARQSRAVDAAFLVPRAGRARVRGSGVPHGAGEDGAVS